MPDRPNIEGMTDVQLAFWVGLTDQRVANMWEAADYIADLKPEAKDFLRTADKETLVWLSRADDEKLKKIDGAIEFMGNAEFMGKWSIRGLLLFLSIVASVIGTISYFKGGK